MRRIHCLALFALSACQPGRPVVTLPPVALTQCEVEPSAPSLPDQDWSSIDAAKARQLVRDNMVLSYVLALRTWGGSCEASVKGLARWREGMD